MRLSLFLAFIVLTTPIVFGQPVQETHSEVLLYPPTGSPELRPGHALAARLAQSGTTLGHARVEHTSDGVAFRTVLSESELQLVRDSEIRYDVVIEDLRAHYLANRGGSCDEGRLEVSRITADLCGSMGGYLTHDGVLAALDALADAYPEIVSVRDSIGHSHEDRAIWLVEISDNPGVDEENEPEALYTSLHHAREPGGMMAVLYFMHYLAEQYSTNSEVANLVDNRRLFFIPIVNPDGFVYNETTDPDGGGFWRKNRRDNEDGSFGVDPNRNYGYLWGYDDIGSSPNPSSGTYRGPAPFSEPENQAIRDFVEDGRRISHTLNYHTFSDLLLFPWGYEEGAYTPDHDEFVSMSAAMTAVNGYAYGQGADILYPVNGDADDYHYGEQSTKPKSFSWTPEVGYSFWPDPYDVYPLADENLEMNLLVAEYATLPVPTSSTSSDVPSADSRLRLWGPNPTRNSTTVSVSLDSPNSIRLSLIDLLGREVQVLAEGEYSAGRHVFELGTSTLAPGTYLVRLTDSGKNESLLISVVR